MHPQLWLAVSLMVSFVLLFVVSATALLGFGRVQPAIAEARDLEWLANTLRAADSEHKALRGNVFASAQEADADEEASDDLRVDIRRDTYLLRGNIDAVRSASVPKEFRREIDDFVVRMTAFTDLSEDLGTRFMSDTAPDPATRAAELRSMEVRFDSYEQPFDRLIERIAARADRASLSAAAASSMARRQVVVSFGFALLCMALTAGLLLRNGRRQTEVLSQLHRETGRQKFAGSLIRALDLATVEPEVYDVVGNALTELLPDRPAELRLSDSSRSHLRPAAHSAAGSPACDVETPWGCPAVRQGSVMTIPSGRALDACPRMRSRDEGAHSAVCLPVTFMGTPLGVIHVLGPENVPLSESQTESAVDLAAQVGTRIGTLRAFATTQLQADTDALTGLWNRRSLEVAVRQFQAMGRPFAVAIADLDHFKNVNDSHGHDAGDRALRVFANLSRAKLRTDDVLARYGGEEFVFVFPDLDVESAALALARVRKALADGVPLSGCPTFTASYGVAHSADGATLAEIVAVADKALRHAKETGRDRIVVRDSLPAGTPA